MLKQTKLNLSVYFCKNHVNINFEKKVQFKLFLGRAASPKMNSTFLQGSQLEIATDQQ